MPINFIEASSEELFLYAFEHPEEFKGDVMKKMLERKDIELSIEIRRLMLAQSAEVTAILGLLLEDSQSARNPSTDYSRSHEGKTHSRVILLERVKKLITARGT
jgi:hypothetical protein